MTDERAQTELDAPAPKGLTAGKIAVLATLSLFILVPAITILSYRIMIATWSPTDQLLNTQPQADGDTTITFDERLRVWQQTALNVRETTLRRGTVSSARNNEIFKPIPFDIPTEEELLVRAAAKIAQQPYAEVRNPTPADIEALQALTNQYGEHFYTRYLLAVWSKDQQQLERALSEAPAVLVQPRYEGTPTSPLLLTFDRVKQDTVDTSLVLWLPPAPELAEGVRVYPLYKSIFRFRDPAASVERADLINPERPPAWFVFPGQVGRIPGDVRELHETLNWTVSD
ncbi:hypothetical protein [Mucisphaera sp.]|uniref:hypothetical protein n=1 Tax=Mucisphaera sp. TaxID=2913024 RepID=UPI003D135013